MQEADRSFTQGLRYILAARRLEDWSGDDDTASKLKRLAVSYRERANALMLGSLDVATAGEETAATSLLEPSGRNQQTGAPRGIRRAWSE